MKKLFRTFEREEREFKFFTIQILHLDQPSSFIARDQLSLQWQGSIDKPEHHWYGMGIQEYKMDYDQLCFAKKIADSLHKNNLFGFGVDPKQVINFLMSKGYQKGIYIKETSEFLSALEILPDLQVYEMTVNNEVYSRFAATYDNCHKIAESKTSAEYILQGKDIYLYDNYKDQI